MDDAQLQSRAHQHSLFFDNLVELFPAKFYIAKEDENTWHYGMSKAERAAAKQVTKEHLKKAKRNRLDPDKITSTLQILKQHQEKKTEGAEKKTEGAEKEKTEGAEKETGADGAENNDLQGKENRASTYEELRERLRKRMEILRAKRNADAAVVTARNARTWKNEKKLDSQNRKRKGPELNHNEVPKVKQQKQENGKLENNDPIKKGGESGDEFEFGRVKMGVQNDKVRGRKKRKETKEHLLAKASKLQSDMNDPEKGPKVLLKHAWSAALSRASGEKVFDDPDRIKQSIKREKHKKKKSIKKWEERKETVKQGVESRQQTRNEHIKERKHQNKEKKIAKREKKLLRPGFEGRRESFLN